MKIIEEYVDTLPAGQEIRRTEEREVPDKVLPDDKSINDSKLLPYKTTKIEKGNLYYIRFNTERNITVKTPVSLDLVVWQITLESVTRISKTQIEAIIRIN